MDFNRLNEKFMAARTGKVNEAAGVVCPKCGHTDCGCGCDSETGERCKCSIKTEDQGRDVDGKFSSNPQASQFKKDLKAQKAGKFKVDPAGEFKQALAKDKAEEPKRKAQAQADADKLRKKWADMDKAAKADTRPDAEKAAEFKKALAAQKKKDDGNRSGKGGSGGDPEFTSKRGDWTKP